MEEWRSANSGAEMAAKMVATDAKMITKWE
ncbi:hypothetical protein RDI58_022465 [Solanum bulbocastanum]|uniref:Uncharacterized protein n=1 Tax=Solanum bulbocastanum TaxID=147425 RepID=A0AAN8Y649_SOLBU